MKLTIIGTGSALGDEIFQWAAELNIQINLVKDASCVLKPGNYFTENQYTIINWESFVKEKNKVSVQGFNGRVVVVSELELSEEERLSFLTQNPSVNLIHGRGKKGYRWAMRFLFYTEELSIVQWRYGEHIDQKIDLIGDFSQQEKRPVVVLLHGGFWRYPYEKDMNYRMIFSLVKQDFFVWNVEYRRVLPDQKHNHQTTEEDVIKAIQLIPDLKEQYAFDLDRVYVMGHSAGGYLAANSVSRINGDAKNNRLKISKLVLLAGILDLQKAHEQKIGENAVAGYLGEKGLAAIVRLSPHKNIPDVPMLIVHGKEDKTVPISISKSFVKEAEGKFPIAFIEVFGADHMDLTKPSLDFWKKIWKFLDKPLHELKVDKKILNMPSV